MWIKSGLLPLLLSYVLALVLMVMPIPTFLEAWRPDWVSMVLIYWLMAIPHRVGLTTVLVMGLLTDILMGTTFGVYATGLLIVAYSTLRHFQRIRNYSLMQQMLVIAALILVKRLVVYQLEHFLNDAAFHWSYLYPVISSMVLWPWLFLVMRGYRRRYLIR